MFRTVLLTALMALGATEAVHAQEPSLIVRGLSFGCEKSITGKGQGLCTYRALAKLNDVPESAKYGRVSCRATWEYGVQGRQTPLVVEIEHAVPLHPRNSGFAETLLAIERDMGSVVAETQWVVPKDLQCSASWTSK